MTKLTDYARSKGAGPVQLSVFDLKMRVVVKARDWVDAQDVGCTDGFIAAKEKALHDAVRALESALESNAGATVGR